MRACVSSCHASSFRRSRYVLRNDRILYIEGCELHQLAVRSAKSWVDPTSSYAANYPWKNSRHDLLESRMYWQSGCISDVPKHNVSFSVPHLAAQGRAGVAVIRVSGPRADLIQRMLRQGRPLPPPRVAQTAHLFHPETRTRLDHALLLYFLGPNSFTGEDVIELHVHGGRAVVGAVLSALSVLPTYRHAEPGEFARRAFDNGRLDLTQVEGLADLIAADTEAQHQLALQQSGGALRSQLEAWRGDLLHCLAHTEAVIDFGEDEDIADE
ncbi:hypothetical protein CYMTET_16959, partial [Cymbomonas tetramitiformis]